jgi:hypothetical protein
MRFEVNRIGKTRYQIIINDNPTLSFETRTLYNAFHRCYLYFKSKLEGL